MFGWLARKLEELPLVVLGGLALIVIALPGVIGWFIGDLIWDHGIAGALTPYAVVIALIAAAYILEEIMVAIGAFVIFAPLTYVLILAQQTLLWAFDLSSYPDIGDFLVRNLDGVLLAASIGALLMMRQWGRPGHGVSFPDQQVWGDPYSSTPPGEESRDADEREQRLLFGGILLRFPLVFLIAGLADIPEAPPARIFVGSSWGIAFAAGAILISTQVYHDPVKDAWVPVALAEGILILLALGTGIGSVDGEEPRRTILQTVPPAAVACAGTYLLVWATAVLRGRRISGRST